ncbi:Uncharacterised protein [uncultured archaeon]|nr:Uncharacterised protein [uncultured archaeon]
MSMNSALRERLAQPFGPVMEFSQASDRLVSRRPAAVAAVGDQVVLNLLRAALKPDMAIVDLKCQRQPIPREWEREMRQAAGRGMDHAVPNPPGTVHPRMEEAVRQLLADGSGWLLIEGEDDLASLVIMAYARIGTLLLYGQPQQGVVWVEIDQTTQDMARELLEKIKRR